MANEENLIPFTSEQNREEAKKNGRKGGIASGEARREKKRFKELIEIGLMEILDQKHKGKEVTVQEGIVLKAFQQALKGDDKARNWLTKVLGELQENINLTQKEIKIEVAKETDKDLLEDL